MENVRLIQILSRMKEVLLYSRTQKGICETLSYLLFFDEITGAEYNRMLVFLKENKPSSVNQFKEFTKNVYWQFMGGYWWNPIRETEATRKIRINYLTKVIEYYK